MSEGGSELLPTGRAARFGLAAGPVLFAAALLLPLPDLAAAGGQVVPASHAVRVVMGLSLWMAAWWMTEAFPLAATSLLPILVLPLAGVLPARDVARVYFDDTIMLFLGGFCLALGGLPPMLVVLAVTVGMTLLSEIANNTAATVMMLPVLSSLAKGLGTAPLPILLAGTLGASCGFALPVATPPNTVAYGTGEVSVRDMVRAGLVLYVAAVLVMTTGVWLLAPLVFGT